MVQSEPAQVAEPFVGRLGSIFTVITEDVRSIAGAGSLKESQPVSSSSINSACGLVIFSGSSRNAGSMAERRINDKGIGFTPGNKNPLKAGLFRSQLS